MGALCALSLPPAAAENVVINDETYDVKELVSITRAIAPQKGQRFHYSLNGRPEELVLSQLIESANIPDGRPYPQVHPWKSAIKKGWKTVTRLDKLFNVGSGCINLGRALGWF